MKTNLLPFKLLATSRCAAAILALFSVQVFAQGPGTLVETDSVRFMEFREQITLVGRTSAIVHSSIVAELSGRVQAINALEGNPVREGDPLVSIDSRSAELLYRATAAEAAQAEQQFKLAADHLTRVQSWFDQKLVAQTSLDSARAVKIISEQRFAQLDANRALLNLDLDNCIIRAPYSGHTLLKMVDVGSWVTPGTPVYEMVDLSEVQVRVDLPERYFGQLERESRAEIEISGNQETLEGIVSGIAQSASAETHTFPVLIRVDNSASRLSGGTLVRATLFLRDVVESLAVSKDALVRQGDNVMVYTVEDGKAAPIPVMTGLSNGPMIAVEGEGLQEHMPVVVRGNERVYPGSPVQVAGAEAASKAKAGENGDETDEGRSEP